MKSLPEVIAAVQLLQKAETERTKITLELKQEIFDLQTKVFELIQNLRNRVNLIDNKSKAKNIMINNVEEKSTENAIMIIIIKKLLKQDYKVQLANNKIQMAWLTWWLVVG